MKYIAITGGVISGVGKGIVSSSVGLLLKSIGYKVTCIKIDPYLNVDAGTIRPYDHGETFVLDDGGECDLDLGSYERFLDITLTKNHNITSGKIFEKIIKKERSGDYLGKTVQMITHVRDEIISQIERIAEIPVETNGDIPEYCIIELGGTIGDLESNIFVEALKSLKFKAGNIIIIHVSMVISSSQEQKTKPTQRSVEDLRKLGLNPDILICRSKHDIQKEIKEKISIMCAIPEKNIIGLPNLKTVYHVPEYLIKQGILHNIFEKMYVINSELYNLHMNRLVKWLYEEEEFSISSFANKINDSVNPEITIALVGKYTKVSDSYLSVIKSLEHAAVHNNVKLNILYVSTDTFDVEQLQNVQGIIVPGGFGKRGTTEIMEAIKFARENKIPFLGICYGFQLAIVEFLRNCCGLNTTSEELDEAGVETCIKIIPESSGLMGGTMKVGSHDVVGTHPFFTEIYGQESVTERCRHRYEFDNKFLDNIQFMGLKQIAVNERKDIMTMFSLESHPFFIGTQFHPEFKTRFFKPHPIFDKFIKVSSENYTLKK